MEKIMHDLHDYWSGRSAGYSEYNKQEMEDERRDNWKNLLHEKISAAFPGKNPDEIRVLDAGAGPGFLSILLAECGYKVTALDYTQEMLDQAKSNAGDFADSITWVLGDVQATEFWDLTFDVIISRNVTWNLPHPEHAYRDWFRILDEGGILLNFDANWYHYLIDEEKKEAYQKDRQKASELGIDDCNVGDGFDRMEKLAEEVPLTREQRPEWDVEILKACGFDQVDTDTEIWKRVWSEDEKVNCASTPMFMICAKKHDIKERVVRYWTKRSAAFLDLKEKELHDPIADRWLAQILPVLPQPQAGKKLRILDVGCGVGYFSILLAKQGFDVIGIDLTADMIRGAKILAGREGVWPEFLQMDAEHPDFPDESFDVIISRNLTWTLPHPIEAYHAWFHLLRDGGVLLNFDANYGAHKTVSQADLPYNHAHNQIGRDMMNENDAIMHLLPISFFRRPSWDAHVLEQCGASSLSIDFRLSDKVYLEKDEFYNPVPMFRLMAIK